MKKLLLSITILLSLFSCKKEKDELIDYSSQYVGSWYVDVRINDTGESRDSLRSSIESISNDMVRINGFINYDYIKYNANVSNSTIEVQSQTFNIYDPFNPDLVVTKWTIYGSGTKSNNKIDLKIYLNGDIITLNFYK